MAECSNVCSLGAVDIQNPVLSFSSNKLKTVNRDLSRSSFHCLPPSGQLVKPFSVHLDGGVHGRSLHDLPLEAQKCLFQFGLCYFNFSLLQYCSCNVLGIRLKPEPQCGPIALCIRFRKFLDLGSALVYLLGGKKDFAAAVLQAHREYDGLSKGLRTDAGTHMPSGLSGICIIPQAALRKEKIFKYIREHENRH